jgi:hypothetical protein
MMKTMLLAVLLAFAVVSIESCSSSKPAAAGGSSASTASTLPFMIGKIEVIGNEPFTRLALRVDPTHVFILQAGKALEKELTAHQSTLVKLYYSGRKESGIDHILDVDHIDSTDNKK